jgi:hypothetical protein
MLKIFVRVVLVVVGLYMVISTIVNLSGANPHWQGDIRSPTAITQNVFVILGGLVMLFLGWKFSLVESLFRLRIVSV